MESINNTHDSYIYIVFSVTPYKLGSFIRAVTRGVYGHVSVSFDPELTEMYAFARVKEDMPFCGGFVHEGAERYRRGDKVADVAVCRVPVSEEGLIRVRERIEDMKTHTYDYVYNMPSAVMVPWRRCVHVRDSYTCLEFAVSILRLAGMKLTSDFYSISELYALLRQWEIYNGEFPDVDAAYKDDSYGEHTPVRKRVTGSAKQILRVTVRLFRH